jgi:hypothetical protein
MGVQLGAAPTEVRAAGGDDRGNEEDVAARKGENV